METQKPLLKDEDGKEVDVHMYRSMIGSLMYLTSSRPDIMFAVCTCTRYQVNPKVSHLHAVKRFFKVKTVNGEVQLHALVDGKKIIINESTMRRDLQLEDAEGIDCLPNSTIFEQLALMGKPKRKDTQVPQPSGPTDIVADEAVYKELGDSLVRVATTASSLEVEQDSGGGPKHQETIGDTISQTGFENVSKLSNDPLLVKGNTLCSGKDSLKLTELMELCTNLQQRVLDLEKTKTTQAKEIVSLKRRVKKLEQKKRSRSHGLKRLHKVGMSRRVESSGDEDSLEQEVVAKDVNLTIDEVTLAQALAALKSVKPKAKEQRRKHFAAKSAEEKRNKLPTQAQQRKIMCTYMKNVEGKKPKDLKNKSFDSIQKMFDRAFKRVNTFVDFRTDLVEGSSKRAGEELEQESTKKQKVDEDKDTTELQSLMEVIPDEEEVAIDVVPLATKPPTIVDWKIHKDEKKREDLEDLYKLVKTKYKSTRLVEDLDLVLWSDLKTMFEPHVEDEIWKLQQRKEISPYTTYNYRYAEQEALVLHGDNELLIIKAALLMIMLLIGQMEVKTAQRKVLENCLRYDTTASNNKSYYCWCKVTTAEGVNAASKEVSTAELVSTAYVICMRYFGKRYV
ncbi:hypothetical protein Tco_0969233 [Tanacetum coccineum]